MARACGGGARVPCRLRLFSCPLCAFCAAWPCALDTGRRPRPEAASRGTGSDARAPLVRASARQVANRVKDGMRENCMPQIADAWHSILQLHGSAPSLVASCLNTLGQFVSWVDITLVAHERFMRLLVPFMRTPALHEGACGCLTEVVVKRMDATLKLEHLARLQVPPTPQHAAGRPKRKASAPLVARRESSAKRGAKSPAERETCARARPPRRTVAVWRWRPAVVAASRA